jgi:hypothetical protein
MFVIIKTGIVPASAQKLKIISLLTRLLLEVGIFNDRLLAGFILLEKFYVILNEVQL